MWQKHDRDTDFVWLSKVSSVCHCSESVTNVLTQDDHGSSTGEYDLTDDEGNGHSNSEVTVTAAATVTPAAASVPTTCDVCLVAAPETIAFVPCGHATFCKQCVETLVAVNGHCPICRGNNRHNCTVLQ